MKGCDDLKVKAKRSSSLTSTRRFCWVLLRLGTGEEKGPSFSPASSSSSSSSSVIPSARLTLPLPPLAEGVSWPLWSGIWGLAIRMTVELCSSGDSSMASASRPTTTSPSTADCEPRMAEYVCPMALLRRPHARRICRVAHHPPALLRFPASHLLLPKGS